MTFCGSGACSNPSFNTHVSKPDKNIWLLLEIQMFQIAEKPDWVKGNLEKVQNMVCLHNVVKYVFIQMSLK